MLFTKNDVVSCTERSQPDVRDTAYDRNLSSGPTGRAAHIVWTKNKSHHLGTKDKHVTTRAGSAAGTHDLQALRENPRTGFKELLKNFSRKDAKAQRKTAKLNSVFFAAFFASLREIVLNYSSTSGVPAPSPSAGAAEGTTIGSRGGITISWPPTMSGNSSRSRSLP